MDRKDRIGAFHGLPFKSRCRILLTAMLPGSSSSVKRIFITISAFSLGHRAGDSQALCGVISSGLRTFLNHVAVLIPDVKYNFMCMERLLKQVRLQVQPETIRIHSRLCILCLSYSSEDNSLYHQGQSLSHGSTYFLNMILAGDVIKPLSIS